MSFYKTKFYRNLSCFSTAVKTIKRNLEGKKLEGEVSILFKFITPGDICCDIGAAYGRYTLPMSKLVGPQGHVYAFEPGGYSHQVLRFVAGFHRLHNVTILKKAAADKEGSFKLASPVKPSGKIGPSLAHLQAEGDADCLIEDIEMVTLDNFCAQKDIPKINFIKCDTEGAELSVFRGGQKTIQRFRPVILSEIDEENLNRFHFTLQDVHDFFRELHYNIYLFKSGQFTAVCDMSAPSNYFFIPAETKPF